MRFAVADMVATRDHFALNPWATGERRVAFHLTLEASPEMATAIKELQTVLSAETAARVVPVRWLHLTMTGCGALEDIPSAGMNRLADRVFAQWQRFAGQGIVYDQVFVADESVMLTARDDDWFHAAATIQRDAVDDILGVRVWNRLWAHTSLAYFTGAIPAAHLRDTLGGPVAQLPNVLVARPTLTLMELHRDTGGYQWRTIHAERHTP